MKIFFKNVPITTLKTGALAYVAGYVVKRLDEFTDCIECTQNLIIAQCSSSLVALISYQDRKALKYPSPSFVSVLVGHIVLSINEVPVTGRKLNDGRDVLEVLKNEKNYPINIKFGRPRLGTNEKIVLASTFHSLFAIASQLSPEPHCSGIEVLEADTFKLYCYQTITGTKFIVVADPKQTGMDSLLKKIYELYSDYALKNPFYSLEMPIRCEHFDINLQAALEQIEKTGVSNI